ncbi:MAG TPA: hypothetical protein VGN96_14025 [Roseococcus sp.]|jgi:hypothetical protein|nr:hypothetical protein [Roseococcus sp.]
MLNDLLAFLLSTFLIAPLQSEFASRLENAPRQVVSDVTACVTQATPALLARAGQDPWWAISTGIGVWIGRLPAEATLREAAPGCGPALNAARPFLNQG